MKKVAALTLAASLAIGATAIAQAPTPLHDEQYPQADIAYGLGSYTAKCVV